MKNSKLILLLISILIIALVGCKKKVLPTDNNSNKPSVESVKIVETTDNKTIDNDTLITHTPQVAESEKAIKEHTNIFEASKYGDLKGVQQYMTNIEDIDIRETLTHKTALMYASEFGQIEVVKYLTKNGATIDFWGAFEKSDIALLLASQNGHIEVVKYLIEKGADVNISTEYMNSNALMQASWKGSLDIVKFLVESGADIHATDRDGETALVSALNSGHTEVVEYLVSKGADINAGKDIAYYAGERDLEGIKKAIANGEDINSTNGDLDSALDISSSYGDLEIVKYLIENNADINSKSGYGTTPLMYASTSGHFEVAKYLIEQGANIAKESSVTRGETALMFASREGNLDIVQLLIANGADINKQDYDRNSVLMHASSHLEVVKFLVEQGADINAKDDDGNKTLDRAIQRKYTDVIEYLESLE